jgi:hypothetical protein
MYAHMHRYLRMLPCALVMHACIHRCTLKQIHLDTHIHTYSHRYTYSHIFYTYSHIFTHILHIFT